MHVFLRMAFLACLLAVGGTAVRGVEIPVAYESPGDGFRLKSKGKPQELTADGKTEILMNPWQSVVTIGQRMKPLSHQFGCNQRDDA